jgi:hypothetical protein
MILSRLLLPLLAVTALACGAEAPGPPYRVELLEHTAPGAYHVVETALPTMTNLDGLDGAPVKLFGGGGIGALSLSAPKDEEAFRRAFKVKDAREPSPRYTVVDGAAHAVDYDTFAMFSIYRAFERAVGFYRSMGVPEEALARMPAYYRASINLVIFKVLSSDNAAYVPSVDGFLMLPDSLEGNMVPLALNLGVVGHEYGHSVFNHLVWNRRIPPYAFIADWSATAPNHIGALEEGLADVFGATLTADPNFIGRSLASLTAARDLSLPRTADAALVAKLRTGDGFDPHELGAVIASALWAAGGTTGREVMARAIVDAERALSGKVTPSFTIATFFDALVGALAESGDRAALCAALKERLALAGPFPRCQGVAP